MPVFLQSLNKNYGYPNTNPDPLHFCCFTFTADLLFIVLENRKQKKNATLLLLQGHCNLQAYERLVILTERVALPNIVSRANQPGITAREMQLLMLESIKQEFEYNSSQQIYVSPVAWQAVNNLKEQNMLIINQIAQTLPADARGYDLGKRIMEVIICSG